MNEKKKIIAVVGPTASGKSALALALAREYNGVIVSCDSMQVYKRMNIGTAKPTEAEMLEVPHRMIDIIEPTESFSCEDYVRRAALEIDDIVSSGRLPIVCGGTGLYLDALLRGGNSSPSFDTATIREELISRASREGISSIYDELMLVDPESALAIHPNNEKRVIRALEIYLATGKKKSELDRLSKTVESPYDSTVIALSYSNRDLLYSRINRRVDEMISEGLVEETRSLSEEGVFEANKTAAQAIGYKELFGYIDGRETLVDAIENLKQATRRYAKRQITWFSAKDYVIPLQADDVEGQKTFEKIVNNAKKLFSL